MRSRDSTSSLQTHAEGSHLFPTSRIRFFFLMWTSRIEAYLYFPCIDLSAFILVNNIHIIWFYSNSSTAKGFIFHRDVYFSFFFFKLSTRNGSMHPPDVLRLLHSRSSSLSISMLRVYTWYIKRVGTESG